MKDKYKRWLLLKQKEDRTPQEQSELDTLQVEIPTAYYDLMEKGYNEETGRVENLSPEDMNNYTFLMSNVPNWKDINIASEANRKQGYPLNSPEAYKFFLKAGRPNNTEGLTDFYNGVTGKTQPITQSSIFNQEYTPFFVKDLQTPGNIKTPSQEYYKSQLQPSTQQPNQNMFGKPSVAPIQSTAKEPKLSTQKRDEAQKVYYDQNSGQWKAVDENNKYDLSNIFGSKPSSGNKPDLAVNSRGEVQMSPADKSWSETSNPNITNPYTPYEPSWTTQKNPNAIDLTDPSKMSLIGPHAYQGDGNEGEGMPKADMFRFPMINPGGSDLSTEIYSLGRALGTEKGTPGRGMNIVGAGGAAALDIARNLASGIGFSKRNQYVMDWYKKKQQERNYVPDSQSEDQNSTGGRRDGGTIGMKLGGTVNMFAEDGMTMPEGQMPPQQPQEQMPEGQGQDQQTQQVVQMIAGMLQQGANPQQVLEALVQQGIPQQQAEQMIQMVVQQMQGQQAPATEQPQDQQMVMKNGGTFDKRVGESVTIKVGGKKVKGVIKEIKNGQITLK